MKIGIVGSTYAEDYFLPVPYAKFVIFVFEVNARQVELVGSSPHIFVCFDKDGLEEQDYRESNMCVP